MYDRTIVHCCFLFPFDVPLRFMQIKIYIGSFLVVLNEYEDVVGRYEREDHLDE